MTHHIWKSSLRMKVLRSLESFDALLLVKSVWPVSVSRSATGVGPRQSRLQCHYRDLSPPKITLVPNNNRNTSWHFFKSNTENIGQVYFSITCNWDDWIISLCMRRFVKPLKADNASSCDQWCCGARRCTFPFLWSFYSLNQRLMQLKWNIHMDISCSKEVYKIPILQSHPWSLSWTMR